ncbi:rhodanese-like domain-containing protein [Bradyrhizobium sp. Gha]|uniref:rhodanese-like domain-containing protein n=1 Tax=Bradyrhizobium sp. Gha TaxID=1855318 RepID=UPI0008EB72A1|nr:rhodanese-like domain-containing protein [Bradyrhizobium sp. Gha]SFJ80356.1 Rhodanese-like domain-containing protein [Bradyrhizobium sp. Gha]
MSASYTSISPDKLSRLVGTPAAPTLIDVRIDEDFSADPRLIPGAVRRSHLDVQDWASRLSGQSVVVVCHKGQKLSEGTAAWLRCCNVAAESLEGGQVGWKEANHATVPAARIPKRDGRGRTPWVTRARPASLGLSRMFDDEEQLNAGLQLYDAFYRWCRDATKELHNWPTHKGK